MIFCHLILWNFRQHFSRVDLEKYPPPPPCILDLPQNQNYLLCYYHSNDYPLVDDSELIPEVSIKAPFEKTQKKHQKTLKIVEKAKYKALLKVRTHPEKSAEKLNQALDCVNHKIDLTFK
jgi:hypothetical protein